MKSPYSIAPAAPYNTLLASLNPLVWWKLDDAPGSTTAADSSGNGHNATATNVTFGSAGPVAGGTAASFNGTSSTLTSSYVLPALDQITAMVWYYVSAWPSGFNPRYVTNNHADGTPYVGFELFLNDPTQVPGQSPMFCVGDGSTSSQQTGLANSGTAGQWHMMVGTYDGKTVSVYQDGQLLASSSFSGQIATSTFGVGGGFGVS